MLTNERFDELTAELASEAAAGRVQRAAAELLTAAIDDEIDELCDELIRDRAGLDG